MPISIFCEVTSYGVFLKKAIKTIKTKNKNNKDKS